MIIQPSVFLLINKKIFSSLCYEKENKKARYCDLLRQYKFQHGPDSKFGFELIL